MEDQRDENGDAETARFSLFLGDDDEIDAFLQAQGTRYDGGGFFQVSLVPRRYTRAMTEVPAEPPQFEFGRPFSYLFDDPRWLQKIGIGGLFYLLTPLIVGWFFLFGYMAQTARNIVAGATHPLPEWENLGTYFTEGARLVGVVLLWMAPLFVLTVALVIPAIAIDLADQHRPIQIVAAVAIGCLSCLLAPLWLAMILLMPMSVTFAAVEQRFGAAFEVRRIFALVRDHIGNYLLAILILFIAHAIGGAGFGVLCFGVMFTAFWALMISTHALAQVYRTAVK